MTDGLKYVHSRSFFGGGGSLTSVICYTILGFLTCYITLHRVGRWSKKDDFCIKSYVSGIKLIATIMRQMIAVHFDY